MAAISWIKRKTITHKQRHAFKITLLEVGQNTSSIRQCCNSSEISMYSNGAERLRVSCTGM